MVLIILVMLSIFCLGYIIGKMVQRQIDYNPLNNIY